MKNHIFLSKLFVFLTLFLCLRSSYAELPEHPWSVELSNSTIPKCLNSNSDRDGDGDGWGWENKKSCRIDSATSNDNLNSQEDVVIDISKVNSNSGFAYVIAKDFGAPSDSGSNKTASTLRLFEDGFELGEPHSNHNQIRDFGEGRYSHYSGKLYFSASDNTDPRENGRVYSYLIGDDAQDEAESIVDNQEDLLGEPDISQATSSEEANDSNDDTFVNNPAESVPVSQADCNSQKANLNLGAVRAVPNFHTMSLYWSPGEAREGRDVTVRFKPCGASQWRDGLNIPYLTVNSDLTGEYNSLRPDLEIYRGSIVDLEPNTEYIVELKLEGTNKTAHVLSSTRNENFPIGKVIDLRGQNLNKTVVIDSSDSGTSNAYTLIDGTGSTINASSSDYGIHIKNLKYAIIRGFKITGARNTGIFIDKADSLVIEENEISNFGSKTEFGNFSRKYNDGIRAAWSRDNAKRLIIQRNKIFNPNYSANSWSQLNADFLKAKSKDPSLQILYKNRHPQGAQAVTLFNNYTGNHIIRYNEFTSTNGNKYNDVIGGGENASYHGFPGPDSDIYGNYMSSAWDDGIESEGGNTNVRVFENYITDVFIAIGNAPVAVGPLYLYRNVTGISKANSSGGYGYFLKMGFASNDSFMNGYTYVFNNSVLQGSDDGFGGVGTINSITRPMKNVVSLNNIYNIRSSAETSFSSSNLKRQVTSSTDYSLSNKLATHNQNESNGINGVPKFTNQGNLFNTGNLTGNFTQSSSSLGLDAGTIIPNFADRFTGSAPDIGAFENGSNAKVYGTKSNVK